MLLDFDFDRLRSGPFEGPAIVKPPALPGDTYSFMRSIVTIGKDILDDLLKIKKSISTQQLRGRGSSLDQA